MAVIFSFLRLVRLIFIDDNLVTTFIDDNSITFFVDDNGVTTI